MISKKKKLTTIRKKKMMDWTVLIANTVARAKKKKGMVILDVGLVKTGMMLQDTLTKMALSGEDAAWDVQIHINTLH
jgi:hypothetical protein